MSVRDQIAKMSRGEMSTLTNSRNDNETEAIRAGWLAWIDTQSRPPQSKREAWYGYSAVRIAP